VRKTIFAVLFLLAAVTSLSAQANPSITIVNNTGYTVHYVYISQTASDKWGTDRLAADETLTDGQSVSLQLPYPINVVNRYDMRLVDSDEDEYIKTNVLVSAGSRIIFTFGDFVSNNSGGGNNNNSNSGNNRANSNTNNNNNTQPSETNIDGSAMLSLINAERINVGAAPLTISGSLTASAGIRAEELSRVFSHTRPDGSSWVSVNSSASGENIAAGSSTINATFNQWMNSQGHRDNMLNPSFKTIGIAGYSRAGTQYTYYWVQLFGR